MKTRILFLALLLTATASAIAVPPTITIGEAVGANPATVYTAGQTTRVVNVAWNAGTDQTYCEIYYTVNGTNQRELGRGHDGAKPLTLNAGGTYEFWMVVYPGNGQYSIVTRLSVVAKQGSATPPPPPPPTGGGGSRADVPGGFGERARRRSDNVTDFRNAPFISDVRVQPDLRNVLISFASTQSTPPLVEISKVSPSRYASGVAAFPSDSGAFSRFATEQKLRYVLDLDAQGEKLEVGTTYHYIINVFNNDRNATTRAREQIVGQFSTLRQSVKVVWEQVHMFDDSDDLSTAECLFWFWANFGQPTGVYSEYANNDMDSGEDYNFNRTVVIPNAPDKLVLHASGQDADGTTIFVHADNGSKGGNAPLTGAGDHSAFGSEQSDTNAAAQEFDLSNFPGDNRTVQFRLETRGGSLKFIVSGHFEITRGAAIEQLGTAVSPLQTAPELPAVEQQFIGTFGKTPTNYQPMWVYAIKNDGDMFWYRKDTGTSPWQGPKKVGNGWNFKDVIPAGGNSFYALKDDGKLIWYRHDGFNDGSARAWQAPVEVGHGWGFKKIFSGGEGIVYAIKDDGELVWYRHGGYADGGGLSSWSGARSVGNGWNGFRDVFSNGGGQIYAITTAGELLYYYHAGYASGERSFRNPKTLATGWQDYRQVIPAGDGVILAVRNDGKLLWYRHYLKAPNRYGRVVEHWEGPVEIGSGWTGFKKVVALLPVASAPVVR